MELNSVLLLGFKIHLRNIVLKSLVALFSPVGKHRLNIRGIFAGYWGFPDLIFDVSGKF